MLAVMLVLNGLLVLARCSRCFDTTSEVVVVAAAVVIACVVAVAVCKTAALLLCKLEWPRQFAPAR